MRLLIAFLLLFSSLAANAKLPSDIDTVLKKELGSYEEQIDLVVESNEKKWLLIKPSSILSIQMDEAENIVISPEKNDDPISLVLKTEDSDFLFSNGWIYTPMKNKSIKSFDFYPQIIQDVLLQSKIHQEFIVPKGFQLPRDLAFLAGRIPLTLGSIELASDRETLYKEKLKQIEDEKPFKFLAYSYNSGNLSEISIDKNSNEKIGEAKDLEADKLGLKYLSSYHEQLGEMFFSDLVTGDIFQFKRIRPEFDARKPNQTNLDPKAVETKIEKIFSLNELGISDGVKDFAFNLNKSYLYVITKKSSDLLIIDFKERVITKRLELPKMIDGFQLISRSAQEPDKLVFFSKAKDIIFFLNTYDLRISDQIYLSKISDDSNYVPYSILVSIDRIFLGVEKVSKLNKETPTAGLMVFDTITNAFQEFVTFNATPKEMLLSNDKKSIYVLAENSTGVIISKIDSKTYQEQAFIALDEDIAQVSSITEIVDGKLLAVPSSISNNIVLIDAEKLLALKKIELKEPVNLLRVIN
jgi:hypothetical protein